MDKETRELIEEAIGAAVQKTAEHLARTFVTMETTRAIANDAVPESLRNLDRTVGSGDVLKLGLNGAEWGTVKAGGLTAKGDMVLYKGVFLREYDEAGVIVAAGSEINPADYATQELYEAALTAAGHTLKPTWDYTRIHG